MLGFFIGIPLLATLPFGSEFQCRTLASLLSQPVRRTEIWAEKLFVSGITAISAAAIYALMWWNELQPVAGDLNGVHGSLLMGAALFVIVTLCSAAAWTLYGKSTLTGLM